MQNWKKLADFPAEERTKLRYLLRHAGDNGIVAHGAAIRYGRDWLINQERLPDFLRAHTIKTLGERAA